MLLENLRNFNKEEILKRIGCIDQICSAQKIRFEDGAANHMQAIDIRTGSGLSFQILPDRGLGIGKADYKGIPLTWISPVLEVAPWYYHHSGNGWLESFGGGLMTSCGLTNVGAASIVDGVEVGLHGRLSHLPATDIVIDKKWNVDGKYKITIRGTMLDHRVLGQSLQLIRSYEINMGESSISIHDEISNIGNKREPLMILYHFNFGYPLISETTKIDVFPKSKISMRGDEFLSEIDEWNILHSPKNQYEERVYFHSFTPSEKSNKAIIKLENNLGGNNLSASLEFSLESLKNLVEWKMLGEKEYVLGIEPGNCFASGRDEAIKNNELEYLEPGETKKIDIIFRVSNS